MPHPTMKCIEEDSDDEIPNVSHRSSTKKSFDRHRIPSRSAIPYTIFRLFAIFLILPKKSWADDHNRTSESKCMVFNSRNPDHCFACQEIECHYCEIEREDGRKKIICQADECDDLRYTFGNVNNDPATRLQYPISIQGPDDLAPMLAKVITHDDCFYYRTVVNKEARNEDAILQEQLRLEEELRAAEAARTSTTTIFVDVEAEVMDHSAWALPAGIVMFVMLLAFMFVIQARKRRDVFMQREGTTGFVNLSRQYGSSIDLLDAALLGLQDFNEPGKYKTIRVSAYQANAWCGRLHTELQLNKQLALEICGDFKKTHIDEHGCDGICELISYPRRVAIFGANLYLHRAGVTPFQCAQLTLPLLDHCEVDNAYLDKKLPALPLHKLRHAVDNIELVNHLVGPKGAAVLGRFTVVRKISRIAMRVCGLTNNVLEEFALAFSTRIPGDPHRDEIGIKLDSMSVSENRHITNMDWAAIMCVSGKNFRMLTVDRCSIVGAGMEKLSKSLIHSNLKVLNMGSYIGGNPVGDVGTIHLAKGLEANPPLEEICLDRCDVGETGVVAMAAALKKNRTLKVLSLRNNLLGDKSAVALADGLRKNATLLELHLEVNSIADPGGVAFNAALEHNKSLNKLTLWGNQLTEFAQDSLKQNYPSRVTLGI